MDKILLWDCDSFFTRKYQQESAQTSHVLLYDDNIDKILPISSLSTFVLQYCRVQYAVESIPDTALLSTVESCVVVQVRKVTFRPFRYIEQPFHSPRGHGACLSRG